ncbi:PAS domain S-box-containing protein/diguanylate cyclase (GGDEF) domain-containing protein [Persephonella hydrogeniphila]|uniref:PAS domain S-box-containing protein/diguanylate cyclase (GGDEF) domain-containing protein n=1 Tax=Persephonella hydrogeniphila TaxID=198703 RepID=A0A285N1U2_9AQUI|nr:EAL domain-containing protein [Persephonella hydrogeniphila]SNZ03434.1 PAS domain S-box-containing protein/diguanylate cyclase (GGDEF) domain-containing protein [Persephonella hydrogeniphila]
MKPAELKNILDYSPDIIFTMSPDGTIKYINRTFSQVLGYQPEEIIGHSVLELLDEKEAFDSCMKILKEKHFCPDQEVFFKTKNGNKIRVIKKVKGITDKNGKVKEIVVNARDLAYLDVLKEKLEDYAEHLEFLIEDRTKELRKIKTFLEDVISSMPDMLVVIDNNEEVVLLNKAAAKLSQKNGDFLNRIHIYTEGKDIRLKDFIKTFDKEKSFKTFNCSYKKNSEKIPMFIVISPLIHEGQLTGFIFILKDISELKIKEEKLTLYKTIFENTLDAIGIIDREGKYVDQNSSNEELLGYSIDEIRGIHFSEILKIKNPQKIWDRLKKEGRLRFVATMTNRKGEERYLDIVALSVKDETGEDKYYVGIKRDITDLIKREKQLEELNKQLEKRLYTDPLTNLPNRLKLVEDLKSIGSPKLAVLNIDDFKEINDFYGYKVGDFVLKEIGNRLKSLLSGKNLKVYKLSGDEFAVLATRYIQSSEFEKMVHNVIYNIQENPIIYNDYEIHLSFTAGIALENHNILNKADMALKYAKENKKPVVSYSEKLQMKELYETNILITGKVKEALKNDRITVYYQPIFDNKTGKAEKYESLVRIIDIDGSIILPGKFLEISKKARLYPEIAKKVVKKAFEDFKELPYQFSINLSVKDIENREITELIFEYLNRPEYKGKVIFEILESEGIENYEEVSGFIKEVKNLGGMISLDDFGAGYSNFEYILKLDVDYIKIDSSLIKNIHSDIYSQIIVETIIGFAQKLGIRTIAEFVHSEDVFDMVKNLGIDYSQGFYLGEPQPIDKLFK